MPAATLKTKSGCEAGIGLADALHHASYKSCDSVATFDDRRLARRAKKLGLAPAVMVVPQRFGKSPPATPVQAARQVAAG